MFHLNRPGGKLPRRSITDIQQALQLLAQTRKGEIPYQPDYGLSAVYQAIGDYTSIPSELEREMSLAIAQFEPRISNVLVKAANVSNTSGRSLRLEISYTFETQPQFFNTTFSLG